LEPLKAAQSAIESGFKVRFSFEYWTFVHSITYS
jgi:hypothetical protein